MAELLLVLWLLALSDLSFTIWAHLFTPFHELNPLAGLLLTQHRLLALGILKVLLTAIGTTIFWQLRSRALAEIVLWGIVLIYVALAIRWSDYTSQILALGLVTV